MRNKKLKVLQISPYFPFPARDGGKVRLFNIIKRLSSRVDTYFLSFVEDGLSERSIEEMRGYCKGVFTVRREEDKRIQGPDIPRSLSFFYTDEMIKKVEEVVKSVKPDVVQIDFLVMTKYIDHIRGIPVVYTEHDMSTIEYEKSIHDRDLPENIRHLEWQRLTEYKKKMLKKISTVVLLTKRDQDMMKSFCGGCDTVVIPTGVDVEYYTPVKRNRGRSKKLIFVGHYKHYPNYDAVMYFLNDIWPSIKCRDEEVTFDIVGSGMKREDWVYRDRRVSFVGEVDDVRNHIAGADVFVAPVRLGGGIKGKVLEAMASGIPVVATEEASAGIECRHNRDILIARHSADFADQVMNLLKDGGKADDIAGNARELVEKRYDWRDLSGNIHAMYERIASGK
ncbi:MAG: glycosyltransferase [Endomicrobiales bacterium]|nr:glycosyltransferase [Endomicrobiales bacterium]